MRIVLFSFLLILLFATEATAQDSIRQKSTKNLSIKLLPNGYYRPETRIGLGAFALLTFKSNYLDSTARWSYWRASLIGTQNRQLTFENDWQFTLAKEKFITIGSLDVTRFPELFFGIGNNTKVENSELYSLNRISNSSLYLFNLKKTIFLGFNLNTQYLWGKDDKIGFVRYSDVVGAKGYFVNGAGPTILYDSRDNVINTHKGWYNEASLTVHGAVTLSDYNYTNLVLNSRYFLPVTSKITWATELYMNLNEGTLPFRSNPALGGFRFLRGYYAGRFRDKNLAFFQSEIRVPIYWRIGVVGFTGIGQVFPDAESFQFNEFKLTGGAGLRFLLSKRENANIRIDYGFTKEGGGFYMVFGETF